MKHARSDYDAIQPWPMQRPHVVRIDGRVTLLDDGIEPGDDAQPIIPEDEPVALLRGQDPIAWQAVEAYCDIAEEQGVQADLVEALRLHAAEMREWCERVGHGLPDAPSNVLRLPQDPPLTDAERAVDAQADDTPSEPS